MQAVVFLASLALGAVLISADDITIAELQHLVQAQASTIETLQARLDDLQARVDKQEQTAAFHVDFGHEPYHGVNFTKTDPILFSRVLLNVGNSYNQVTGKFTAPVSGIYSFALHVMGSNVRDGVEIGVYSAAGSRFECIALAEGSQLDTADQGSCTGVVSLRAGDEVYVKYFSEGLQLWGSYFTSFKGTLIQSV